MDEKFQVIFNFPTQTDREVFLAWFMDGGGEWEWLEAIHDHDDRTLCNFCQWNRGTGKLPHTITAIRLDEE